jgi:hypothetical protein
VDEYPAHDPWMTTVQSGRVNFLLSRTASILPIDRHHHTKILP